MLRPCDGQPGTDVIFQSTVHKIKEGVGGVVSRAFTLQMPLPKPLLASDETEMSLCKLDLCTEDCPSEDAFGR